MSSSWRALAEELPGLAWLRSTDEGRAWLEDLDDLVTGCLESWSLTPGEPYRSSTVSMVLAVRTPERSPAVLKIQFPDRESTHEAEALARWAGRGAVELLAHDPPRRALLLERCHPGTPLSGQAPERALSVLAGLVGCLGVPTAGPFTSLHDEAAHWATGLAGRWHRAGRPFERALLDTALAILTELPRHQGPQVLVHQDLHADNVLSAQRRPWLAIDPKPIVGELEFAAAPVVRSTELGDGPKNAWRRLDRLVGDLGLDAERARGWALAQTLAWAFVGDRVLEGHVAMARWLLERPR